MIEAAEMANAHSFIMQTTMRYDTNVGEKGSQMSGKNIRINSKFLILTPEFQVNKIRLFVKR